MKNIILVLGVFLLNSCATISDNLALYPIYKSYISSLEEKEYEKSFGILSSRNKNDLLKNSSMKKFSKHYPVLSSLNTVLFKETEHFENINSKNGCLTVNGFDSSKEPTSINLEFIKENNKWKLDYTQIMFHGSNKEFPIVATCPTRL